VRGPVASHCPEGVETGIAIAIAVGDGVQTGEGAAVEAVAEVGH
jgi:hypothetical protein